MVDAVFNYPTLAEAYEVAALDVTNKAADREGAHVVASACSSGSPRSRLATPRGGGRRRTRGETREMRRWWPHTPLNAASGNSPVHLADSASNSKNFVISVNWLVERLANLAPAGKHPAAGESLVAPLNEALLAEAESCCEHRSSN